MDERMAIWYHASDLEGDLAKGNMHRVFPFRLSQFQTNMIQNDQK